MIDKIRLCDADTVRREWAQDTSLVIPIASVENHHSPALCLKDFCQRYFCFSGVSVFASDYTSGPDDLEQLDLSSYFAIS
jgi:hypothetical protein